MTHKVLITCPPMLRHIDKFSDKFKDLGIVPSTQVSFRLYRRGINGISS